MIHDAALRAGGLLDPALGGPPVRPYQPEGIWEETTMGRFHYEPSEGRDRYRRSVYAFWRRSVAPTFLFDTAQRRVCEVAVARTNTPLQALTLLNDRTYVEAAAALAALVPAGCAPADRVRTVVERVLGRPPDPRESASGPRRATTTATTPPRPPGCSTSPRQARRWAPRPRPTPPSGPPPPWSPAPS
jgi:hypothetical protein